jgi:parallel beta-helix repeat protein
VRTISRSGIVMAASVLVGGLWAVSPAQAAPLGCGQVVTTSMVLTADVGPCHAGGIVVGADNITLDLGGHHVFGTPSPGDGAGVLVKGRKGVTVRNGLITDFDGGVLIAGGSSNVVQGITAQNNIGSSGSHTVPDTELGDGIAIEGSANNSVIGNTAVGNGPFSGIGLFTTPDSDHTFTGSPTTGNLIKGNIVTDNVACRDPLGHPGCDNDGIRLEPGVGPNNRVTGNTVARNGLDGISLFADTDHNVVQGNTVDGNGFHGAVLGDGIRIFGSANVILGNSVSNSAAGGISVGRRPISAPGSLPPSKTGNPRGKNNTFTGNFARASGIYDLYDSNPSCDNNVWRGNFGTTTFPACTTG